MWCQFDSMIALICLLLVAGRMAVGQADLVIGQSCGSNDPTRCRMVVTGASIYALTPDNFDSSSSSAIVMVFDLRDDPLESNKVAPWIPALDPLGLTVFEYSRAGGPLGLNGPIGYSGPLGSVGNIPNRFQGRMPTSKTRTYENNWCDPAGDSSASSSRGANDTCVYGPAGPLGELGPLDPFGYFFTMYHLGEGINFEQNYNMNLDSSGVWGVQGPLGPTGALGPLGPLGPFGISLQPGVVTLTTGEYQYNGSVIRTTSPIEYAANGTIFRVYDLFEIYTRAFALEMMNNDCSFGIDSYLKDPEGAGDTFIFLSNHTQFVTINIVPVNVLSVYGLTLAVSHDGGRTFNVTGQSLSNPYSSDSGIQNFIVTRANPGEMFGITVSVVYNTAPVASGYYLYVTGSGLTTIAKGVRSDDDVWGPRQQTSGPARFNINGAHQSWQNF